MRDICLLAQLASLLVNVRPRWFPSSFFSSLLDDDIDTANGKLVQKKTGGTMRERER